MAPLKAGQCIDSYRLVRPIGRGGFGTVWLASSEAMGVHVALKVLDQGSSEGSNQELAAVKTYKRLALAERETGLMGIEHVGLVQGRVFYVLPLADGEVDSLSPDATGWRPRTLAASIEQQRHAASWFSPAQVVAAICPICVAAQTLADAGLVHRDIKPENILFVRGQPVLSDVSLLRADSLTLTRIGTPGYAAPSWYAESGGKLDMFSLAATLFTLLTGHAPDKLGRAAFRWPPQGEASLSTVERSAWLHFHRVILRATHEESTERYLTFTACAEDLRRGASLAESATSHITENTPVPLKAASQPIVTLRVRLLAPKDVEAERMAALEVINRLSLLYRPNLTVELAPLEHNPASEKIDGAGSQTPAATLKSADLVIGVLWSQLDQIDEQRRPFSDGEVMHDDGVQELAAAHEAPQSGQALDLMLFVKTAIPDVSLWSPDSDQSALRQHQKLNNLLARLTVSRPGGLGGTVPTLFPDTAAFTRLLELHLRQWLERYAPLADSAVLHDQRWTEGNPYRGLAPFEPKHARVFFGRDAARVQAWQRLIQPLGGFLLVVGGSGTGKSSFVRAGLIPHLPTVMSGGRAASWIWAITSPAGDGLGPLTGLLHTLRQSLPDWRHGLANDDALLACLRATPGVLGLLLAQALALQDSPTGEYRHLFLLVDQGEELFAASVTESERSAYIAALESLLATGRIWTVMTLRADRYGELQQVPSLLALKDGRQLDLAPPSTTELAEIILRPAQAARLAFEFRQGRFLNQVIAEEARHFGECLPLLQFALTQLHEAAKPTSGRRLLTYAAYAQIGGLSGAIAQHAATTEASLQAKLGDATTGALSRLFAALVRGETTGDGLPLRCYAPLADLAGQTETRVALEHLIVHRLLATGGDPECPVVTLGHEVLLTRWPRLAEWIARHRRALQDRARLEPQAQLWIAQGKRSDLLLPEGQALALAEDVLNAIEVTKDLRDYIECSRAHAVIQRETSAQHQKRRTRQWAIAAMVGLALAATATVFGFSASKARTATHAEQLRTQEAFRAVQAHAAQLQKNDAVLTANLTPLIYNITVKSDDWNLKIAANKFLDATHGLYTPKYNPDSFLNSYHAALLCQQLCDSVIQSRGDLVVGALMGRKLTSSDEASLRRALDYAENSSSILALIRQRPTLAEDLLQLGPNVTVNDFMATSEEGELARAGAHFYLGNYQEAIRLYTSFTTTMSAWKPDSSEYSWTRHHNLFEAYTNLAHCYRFTGDADAAVQAMGLALDAGEMARATRGKSVNEIVLLRYALADHLEMLDAKHTEKFSALLKQLKIDPAQMKQLLLGLLAQEKPSSAAELDSSLPH